MVWLSFLLSDALGELDRARAVAGGNCDAGECPRWKMSGVDCLWVGGGLMVMVSVLVGRPLYLLVGEVYLGCSLSCAAQASTGPQAHPAFALVPPAARALGSRWPSTRWAVRLRLS